MNSTKLFFYVHGAIIVCLSVLSIFLIREYRYFAHQIKEFARLKEDYNSYVLALKKTLAETVKEAEQNIPAQKKKENSVKKDSSNNSFVVVNRSPKHLRNSALRFARKHHLERVLDRLYDDNTMHKTSSKKQKHHTTFLTKLFGGHHQKISQLPTDLSLQPSSRPLLRYPIDRAHFLLTGSFGPRKRNGRVWEFHGGIDMAAAYGMPVCAAADGVVVEALYHGGYGNTILLEHHGVFKTRYAHLSRLLVKKGQQVTAGQMIGRVGATGHVRGKNGGIHLHFEVYMNEKRVNPFYFLA